MLGPKKDFCPKNLVHESKAKHILGGKKRTNVSETNAVWTNVTRTTVPC